VEISEEAQKILDEVHKKFSDPANPKLTIEVGPGRQMRDLVLPD
jgi:hypothetical protein